MGITTQWQTCGRVSSSELTHWDWLIHSLIVSTNNTMLPKLDAGSTFLSATDGARWGQISGLLGPVNRANYEQLLEIHVVATPTKDFPIFSGGNMNHRH